MKASGQLFAVSFLQRKTDVYFKHRFLFLSRVKQI